MLRATWKTGGGQSVIEHSLLLSFAAMAAATLFLGAGGSVRGVWATTQSRLMQASTSGSSGSGKQRSVAAVAKAAASERRTTAVDDISAQDKVAY